MKVEILDKATRCEVCGIIIGSYYNKRIIHTKYNYPILYDNHIVDIGCYLAIKTGYITPRYDALKDPMLKN